jgi:hypothetical protein
MANKLASFMSGAQLVIYIGGKKVAFAQGLSFQESMDNVPVGGVGSFSYHAIEPLRYSASGSISVTRWSSKLTDAIKSVFGNEGTTPNPIAGAAKIGTRDGNSLLDGVQFNPVKLLSAATFDVVVYDKVKDASGNLNAAYKLENCRLSGYSFGFSPATLLQEGVTFICTSVVDYSVAKQEVQKKG